MSGFGAGGGFGPPSIQRQGFGSASAAPPLTPGPFGNTPAAVLPQQQSFFGGTPAATAAPFGSAPTGFGANSTPGQQPQPQPQQLFGNASAAPSSMTTTGFGVPTPSVSGFGNSHSNASHWGNSSSAAPVVSQTNHTIAGTTPGFGMAPSFGGAMTSTALPSTNNTGSTPLTQFGTSANLVSMAPQQQQQPFAGTSSFGGNINSAGFGDAGNQQSINNTQSGFGSSGFGTATSSSSSYAFGDGSSSGVPSSGFASTSPAFSTSSQGQPQQQQQLSSANHSSGWGKSSSSSSNAAPTSTYTADTMGGFGFTMGMDAPPFGGTAPAAAAAGQSQNIVFGTSLNLAQPSEPSSNAFGGGFGSSSTTTTNAGFGTTPSSSGVGVGFGSSTTNTGFGTTPSSSSGGFGSSTTSTGFGTTASSIGGGVGFGSSTTSTGFGTMPSSSGGGNDSDGGMKDTNFGTNRSLGHGTKAGRGLSPVPERADAIRTPPGTDGDSELAKLKARIQEKKRRLEEQRKKAQQESAAASAAASAVASSSASSSTPVTTSAPATTITSKILNASAPAFAPGSLSSVAGPSKLLSQTGSGNLTQADKEARAIANAERFSNNATGRAPLLPPDLIAKSKAVQADIAARQRATMLEEKGGSRGVEGAPTSSLTSPEEDEDFTLQSGSLTGTCLAMCPDEELIRREMEGDIQLLETPHPKLHPADWNLRNTAVKRFRRSAADFKLNIPELIRPPDVLERVCGYLEEWVMERDRQGADPRYPNLKSPPPLDVYQFIWDRTRMIRKDFILQNYVGTGAQCDARAVRCHERIARWHTMCEHQLSHIRDFMMQQSQQNIQELGQTLKTLNLYYDDALGRSTVELADEHGNEIATPAIQTAEHGCSSNTVQGGDLVDFDGKPLKNDKSSISNRIIGNSSLTRGTAEPEMRGLYILLTINNDGGMEVLKYVGRLAVQRPEIYNSRLVQLALKIYQTQKSNNYASFFSILRHPSTPYLYACIMFLYVEQMRKMAFLVMSKTFGGRRKDGKTMYDDYRLTDLVRLLCFEDVNEAKNACKYYNITVKEAPSRARPGQEVTMIETIFWAESIFKEPKDPEKGIILILKPRKMLRTIESKLQGATRLAICRGEVSGEGATLAEEFVVKRSPSKLGRPAIGSVADLEKTKRKALEEQQRRNAELERLRKLQAEKEKERLKEEQRKKEQIRQEAEKKRRKDERERAEHEEAKRRELLLQAQRAKELETQQAEEGRKRAIEVENNRRIDEAKKRQLEKEQEERRIAQEKEEQRLQAMAEEKERRRQEVAAREQAKEEQRLRLLREAEDKSRHEEEARQHRLYILQQKRAAEEERERQDLEEAERKAALEWRRKIDAARKILVWQKWASQVQKRRYSIDGTRRSLECIDPTFSYRSSIDPLLSRKDEDEGGMIMAPKSTAFQHDADVADTLFYRLGNDTSRAIDLSDLLVKNLVGEEGHHPNVILCKVAVVSFHGSSAQDQYLHRMLTRWIHSRLMFDSIVSSKSLQNSQPLEVRVVSVNGSDHVEDCCGCDIALFVIPPYSTVDDQSKKLLSSMLSLIGSTTPRMILNLDDKSDSVYSSRMRDLIANRLCSTGSVAEVPGIPENANEVDLTLEKCCAALMKEYADAQVGGLVHAMENISLEKLGIKCIRDSMWKYTTPSITINDADRCELVALSKQTLDFLTNELHNVAVQLKQSGYCHWPAKEFAQSSCDSTHGPAVEGFFGSKSSLPLFWDSLLTKSKLDLHMKEVFSYFNETDNKAIEELLSNAPIELRYDAQRMINKRQFKGCFESAVSWREKYIDSSPMDTDNHHMIYLPKGETDKVISNVIQKMYPPHSEIDYDEAPNTPELSIIDLIDDASEYEREVVTRRTEEPSRQVNETPMTSNKYEGRSCPTPILSPQLSVHSSKRSANMDSSSCKKRRRVQKSKEELQSCAFTAQLEALLAGDMTADLKIGENRLASILGKSNVSKIKLPTDM